MIKKSLLIYSLFEMCYENNIKAYILHKKAYDLNDVGSDIEADYLNGKADGAEEIIKLYNY